MSPTRLSASLRELGAFFVGDRTVQETLERVSELTVEAVPAAKMVGITMLVEGQQSTAVFTDLEAVEIDQAQYDSGDGPCVTAFREARITSIDDTSEHGEWQAFRTTAAEHGIVSTMSFPLMVGSTALGAMNLYAVTARAFDDEDRSTGELFATQAAIVLGNAMSYWDARSLSARLGEAMESRASIEQAKGILMARQHIGPDEAFEVLVRASQRENIKVRDLASRLVADARAGRDGEALV